MLARDARSSPPGRPLVVKRGGLLVLIGAAVCIGALHALEKRGIQGGADPWSFAVLRSLAALAALALAWRLRTREAPTTALAGSMLLRLALVGVIASGVVLVLGLIALQSTQATNKGVITALYPVGTAAFAWWLYGRGLTWRSGPALGLVVVGLVLLTSRGLAQAPQVGDWLMLATVPMVGFTDAYAKRVLQGVSPLTLALGRYTFGALFLVAVYVAVGAPGLAALGTAWPWAVGAGLASAAGVTGLYVGVSRRGPLAAALVVSAAPIVTLALDAAWLRTAPGAFAMVGTLLVVAGVALFEWLARE